ncbi:MAG: TonB family protein [Acidobacteria bacterium]|nr:TonB family protein [Acidobacteriota bacterium]
MSAQAPAKPYDRLGPFVLFRKLDTDALGETWRTGILEPPAMGPVLATRKLTGSREAWAACFPSAKLFAEKIGGATIAKAQRFEFADGKPVIAWEYAGGRSLAHISASAATARNPIPTDQAIAIAEKVASALESINTVKQEGKRLVHGALVPQFVWISEDGDVRVAGQLLGKALVASLSDASIAKELGPFVAPELRSGGEPTKHSDVYAAGAILFLAVTGSAPPDGASGGVVDAVQRAKLAHGGEPIPADIKAILLKSLATDPSARYDGASELHKALTELLGKGQYAPTTFNLAFYLHNLLRSEMETEQKERERESNIDVKGYLEDLARPAPAPAPQRPQPAQPAPPVAPMFGSVTFDQPKKAGSKMPLVAVTVVVLGLAAGGAWFLMGKKDAPPAKVAQATPPPVTQTVAPAPVAAAPVVAALPGQDTEAPSATTTDAEARRKAVEEEINRRVAAEMAKVQAEYNKELLKQQDAAARATGAQPPPATKAATPAIVETAPVQPAATAPAPETTTQAPVAATTTQAPAAAAAAQQPPPAAATQQPPAPRAVETGDFIASTELDQGPKAKRRVDPVYPPMAARQRVKGVVILGLLINETGRVQDVRVLSVDKKGMGFEEAAVTAAKQFTYDPGVKDGKKVKTLIPVPFMFGK